MAINRSQIPSELRPGLAAITGKYKEMPAHYKELFHIGQSRMAVEISVEMAFVGLAQLKGEGSATAFDNAAGERFKYNIQNNAVGLGYAMTREAIDDNLYKDQFGPNNMGLARAFRQTKEILCANVLNTGNVVNSTIGGDGVALFATNHPIDNGTYGNRPATDMDFNESSLEAALTQINYFPDQRGLLNSINGRKLAVAPANRWAAERIVKTEYRPGTNNNDVNAIMSSGALPGGYTVNPFFTSAYAWFLLTDLDGEGLVLYDRVPYEMDIDVDAITGNLNVTGYERYGIGYNNPRGVWGTFPTS